MRLHLLAYALLSIAAFSSAATAELPDWAVDKPDAVSENERKLSKKITVAFDHTRVEDAVAHLRELTGANLVVNWRALEGAGIEPGTTVTLNKLTDVPANRVLDLVLDHVGGDLVPLGLDTCTDDDVATISTQENLGKFTRIRRYDIRPLLPRGVNHEALDLNRDEKEPGLFEHEDLEPISREEWIGAIMDKVRDTIDPDNWRSAGGLVSSMTEHDGVLIINTTCNNHRTIAQLLRIIADNRREQVSIHAQAVAMPTAAAHALIEKHAGGKLIINAETAAKLAASLAEQRDDRKQLGSGRFTVFDEQKGYVLDRSIRTHLADPTGTATEQNVRIEVAPDAKTPEKQAPTDKKTNPDPPAPAKPVNVNIHAPRPPEQEIKRANLPIAGLSIEVRPTLGLAGDELTLEIRVDQASPVQTDRKGDAPRIPDYTERRVRSTVRIADGGGAIFAMPDAQTGGEVFILIRASMVK